MNIAICVVTYNRLNSLKRLLKDLENSYYHRNVTLIISVDKSSSDEIEKFVKSYNWPFGEKRCAFHETNLGLRKHIIEIGSYLDEFDAIVVLEDDISVSSNFYNYALSCVDKYFENDDIAGISLYRFPLNYHNTLPFIPLYSNSDVFLMQNAMSWGEIWMKRQWKEFMEWYELNKSDFTYEPHLPKSICSWGHNSWLKYHTKYCIEKNKYFVYPYNSLSSNNSEKGEHSTTKQTQYQTSLFYGEKNNYNLNEIIKYDAFFENEILYDFFKLSKDSLCIDFYGTKKNILHKRYFLTREHLDYRILASYGLQLKPYEMNIIKNVEGNDLFLYDTSIQDNFKQKTSSSNFKRIVYLYEYLYKLNLLTFFASIMKKSIINR